MIFLDEHSPSVTAKVLMSLGVLADTLILHSKFPGLMRTLARNINMNL